MKNASDLLQRPGESSPIWLSLANWGVRVWQFVFVVLLSGMACAPNKAHDRPNIAERAKPDSEGPDLKIVRPSNNETVSGWVTIEVDISGATSEHTLSWLLDGEPIRAKSVASTLQIKTSAYEDGKHTIGAELIDKSGTACSDQVTLTFANPEHELRSYHLDRDAYANGEQVELTLEYSHPGLSVSADFAALDTHFDASKVTAKDLGGGQYLVAYPISAGNSAKDGTYSIAVTALGDEDQPTRDMVRVRLRQAQPIPFSVESAVFIDSERPGFEVSSSIPAPRLTAPPIPLLTGTTLTVGVDWEQPLNGSVDRLLVAAKGWHGYYVVRVEPNARRVDVTLGSLKPGVEGALQVEIVPVSADGLTSGAQTMTVQVTDVGLGGIQVTLFWDAPVDLDLSVVDPAKSTIDFSRPGARGGVLNFDANALCAISPAFAENISWTSAETLLGDYEIRISLFDNCGYDGPINWWIVGAAAVTSNVQFKPAALASSGVGADGATSGADGLTGVHYSGTISPTDTAVTEVGGMSAGPPVTVGTAQRIGGVIGFKKNPLGQFTDERARFVPVRAVSVADGKTLLGETTTDRNGAFSITLDNPKNQDYRLTVEAVYSRAGAPEARVTDHGGATVHAASSPTITAKPGSSIAHNLVILPENNSGAFNILDNLRRGYDWVFSHWANAPLGVLAARWQREVLANTWFVLGPKYFEVNGDPADPDEFDDSVLLHEFIHYVYWDLVNHESVGGVHRLDSRCVPALAFTEGLATAVAQEILHSPEYVDKTMNNTRAVGINIETRTDVISKGQDPNGNISELLVAMVIYDLFDGVDATQDPADKLSTRVATAATFLRDLKSRKSRTANNINLVDFLDGWRCRSVQDPELNDLLQDREFHYDFIPSPVCQ